jgi:hypothetical protein
VGNNEEPCALVRGADIGRSYNSPPDIHPQAGKVGKDGVKPKSKVACDVLSDDDSGS